MKNLLILLALFFSFNFNTFGQNNGPDGCNELFISELTFGKVPNQSLSYDLNYAIEIFNPTNASINLSNYTLDLISSSNVITTLNLNGTLNSHDVVVLCNNNADLNLQGLADYVFAGLNFENNVILELKNGNTVIDRIGQLGAPTPGNIDFVQLLQDPFGYLQTFHIDLNDYKNIDIRRGVFVDKGNPNFIDSTNDIINDWYYTLNIDRTNIGTHLSICNKPAGMKLAQYFHPIDNNLYNINDIFGLLVNFDINVYPNADMVHTIVPAGTTAIFNTSNPSPISVVAIKLASLTAFSNGLIL